MIEAKQAQVLCVCGDPGGAAALVPVICRLLDDSGTCVHLFAYHQAKKVFDENNLAYTNLRTELSIEDSQALMNDLRIQLLITGTSFNDLEHEKKFIAGAKDLRIPSLSVLDFWSSYAKRFSCHETDLGCLPDRIAIMDRLAMEEMETEGIPGEILVITGQPGFDMLKEKQLAFSQEDQAKLRERCDIGVGDLLLIFVSQPLSALFGKDDHDLDYLGYDEQTVFADLVIALEAVAVHQKRDVHLIIQPHLRETNAWWETVYSDLIEIKVAGDEEFWELALLADMVAGITSTKLVEAAILGCRTLSLQINARPSSRFDTERLGIDKNVFSVKDLEEELQKRISAGPETKTDFIYQPDGCAAARVEDLIFHMLSVEKSFI